MHNTAAIQIFTCIILCFQTTDINDDYIGSGKLLQKSVNKYGVENFKKEILFVFDNEAEMNAKEQELVTEEFVLLETNYNLCVGGHGGFSYLNINQISVNNFEDSKIQTIASKKGIAKKEWLYNNDPDWVENYSKNKSIAQQQRFNDSHGTFLGKKHTDKTKKLIGEKNSINQSGSKNSQFGSKWITNGKETKKVSKETVIPDGWYAGRKINS